jgi:hypothetical protein
MYLIVLIPLTQSLRRSDKELLLGKKLSKVKERNLELQDKLENASNHYEERIQHLKTKAEENDRLKKDIDTLHVGSQEAKSLVLEQKQILIRERNKCKQIEMDKQDLEDRCKYEVRCSILVNVHISIIGTLLNYILSRYTV